MENREQITDKKANLDKLKVLVRVRKLIGREVNEKSVLEVSGQGTIKLAYRDNLMSYAFDHVLGPASSQEDVWSKISKHLHISSSQTILAYGHTSSGKTHTIFGQSSFAKFGKPSPVLRSSERDGVAQRLMDHLYSEPVVKKLARVRLSFFQIYNEKIIDLLDMDNKADLAVKLHPFEGVIIDGLSEYQVQSLDEALALMARGYSMRKVRDNSLNKHSSRSHTILQVVCEPKQVHNGHQNDSPQKMTSKVDPVNNRAKFCVCDLAGSEKYVDDVTYSKVHFAEMKNINLSLSCLSKVIIQLTTNYQHIHYRESKLTRVLQDSLSGPTPIIMVATLSPAESFVDESMNTLKFAQQAKKLKVRVEPDLAPHTTGETLAHYKRELDYYKTILQLKQQATDSKSSFIYRIKQLESDKNKLVVEDSLHRKAIEDLQRENAMIKRELEVFRSRVDDNESLGISSPKKSVLQSSENLELRKTLQFKGKFRGLDSTTQGRDSIKPTREEHLISIFDSNTHGSKVDSPVERPIKEKLERSLSLKNISLAELPTSPAVLHKRTASEKNSEGNLIHGNPNSLVELSPKKPRVKQELRQVVILPAKKEDPTEEVLLSDSETPESGMNPQQLLRFKNTFYQNYIKLGQRIKQLNNEIESSKLPPIESSPRRSWLPQPLKLAPTVRQRPVASKEAKVFLKIDESTLWQNSSPKHVQKKRFSSNHTEMRLSRDSAERALFSPRARISSYGKHRGMSPGDKTLAGRSVGIGRTDPLNKRKFEPFILQSERGATVKFASTSEALAEYEKYKKGFMERSRSLFKNQIKLDHRRPFETSQVTRLKKLYNLEP